MVISQQGLTGQKGKQEGVHMALLIKQHEHTHTPAEKHTHDELKMTNILHKHKKYESIIVL